MHQHDQLTDTTTSFRISASFLARMDHYCRAEDISRSQLIRKLLYGFEPLKNVQVPTQTYPQWLSRGE
jgi:hypothetical protein